MQYKNNAQFACALPAPADHAHGLLTFIEHHKIRVLRFASRQRQKTAGIKHPDAIFMSVGNGRQAHRTRSLNLGEFLFCFAFLARTPDLYRKKCKACQDDNHFNFKECKRCGGALARGTTATIMECQLFV